APPEPVTFRRDGLPIMRDAAVIAVIAAALAGTLRIVRVDSQTELLASLALWLVSLLVFVVVASRRLRHKKDQLERAPVVTQAIVLLGTVLVLVAILFAMPRGIRIILTVLPVLVPVLITPLAWSILASGFPRRTGTQRVCKFCDYEYTFGYPPETDPTAPPRCPECGKGWLADLAVGVKRSNPRRIAIGGVLVLTAIVIFTVPFWNSRTIRYLPSTSLRMLALSSDTAASAAWDALQPALANYTPEQHQELFEDLLAKRLERPYTITPSQHAYLMQQVTAMPAALQERFYRELIEIKVTRVQSDRLDRTHIAISARHLGAGNATAIARVASVTVAGVEQPIDLVSAWNSMNDAAHFFSPISTFDQPLIISIPVTRQPITVRFRIAIPDRAFYVPRDTSVDPTTSLWIGDDIHELPAN
ncbi:MAG TPA: hypothetical protein VK157_14665, partial [Phycisphaerales bacterium]|nr:hypothetical protein [Phycisphaerales bacterium]